VITSRLTTRSFSVTAWGLALCALPVSVVRLFEQSLRILNPFTSPRRRVESARVATKPGFCLKIPLNASEIGSVRAIIF